MTRELPTIQMKEIKSFSAEGGAATLVDMNYVSMNNNDRIDNDNSKINGSIHGRKYEALDLFWELIAYMRHRSWKKKILTVVVVAIFVLVLVDLIFLGNIAIWLTKFVEWMQHDHAIEGVIAFIGLFIFTTLIFIPPFFLTFGCGYVFAEVSGLYVGIIAATMACFIGSFIGANIAFIRARYMMRDLIHLFAKRYSVIRAADRAITRDGFRVMFLLRLCPIIPFNAINYIGGITGISGEAFALSLVGILPIQILTVAMGATAGELVVETKSNEELALLQIIFICSGLAFAIIAFAIIYFFAQEELQKELNRETAAIHSGEADPSRMDNESVGHDSLRDEGFERDVNYREGVDDEEWFWVFS